MIAQPKPHGQYLQQKVVNPKAQVGWMNHQKPKDLNSISIYVGKKQRAGGKEQMTNS